MSLDFSGRRAVLGRPRLGWLVSVCLAGSLLGGPASPAGAQEGDRPAVGFTMQADGVAISAFGKPFGVYVFKDGAITRPFFKDLHAPDGTPVTRSYPPVKGTDRTDHPTMHPGLWMAFGDLSGADSWRNKDRIEHAGFVEEPSSQPGRGTFAVRNRYWKGNEQIGEEVLEVTILARPERVLLLWDSTFRPRREMVFGDQEEMGLGVRLATPLIVQNGGRITNSDGLTNEAHVWGKTADWCAYAGTPAGHPAGIVLIPHPTNFRRSWFHARDYGLLVANPFGRKAFTKAEASRVTVRAGETLRLRFGVAIHSGASATAGGLGEAAREYLDAAGRD